jgi:hypothetical protein
MLAERSHSTCSYVADDTTDYRRSQAQAQSGLIPAGFGSTSLLRGSVDDLIRPMLDDLVQKNYGTLKPF